MHCYVTLLPTWLIKSSERALFNAGLSVAYKVMSICVSMKDRSWSALECNRCSDEWQFVLEWPLQSACLRATRWMTWLRSCLGVTRQRSRSHAQSTSLPYGRECSPRSTAELVRHRSQVQHLVQTECQTLEHAKLAMPSCWLSNRTWIGHLQSMCRNRRNHIGSIDPHQACQLSVLGRFRRVPFHGPSARQHYGAEVLSTGHWELGTSRRHSRRADWSQGAGRTPSDCRNDWWCKRDCHGGCQCCGLCTAQCGNISRHNNTTKSKGQFRTIHEKSNISFMLSDFTSTA